MAGPGIGIVEIRRGAIMKQAILGISAYYHDSAAAILVNGEIVAAAHEERFTRKKQDSSFPIHAARYVLEEAGVEYKDLLAVAFYDKPFLTFERLLETYDAFAPRGLASFRSAIPVWIKEKLFMKRMLRESLAELGKGEVPIFFPEHHLSHAASAFYPSPFEEAAIVTIDGVGEWATTTIGRGEGKDITIHHELRFPHSVGLLYSAFTYYTGFRVNSGEYKLMGLAPYGNIDSSQTADFKSKIVNELVDIRKDGSILLNMDYFDYATGLRMVNEEKWPHCLGFRHEKPETEISQDLYGHGAGHPAGDGRDCAEALPFRKGIDPEPVSRAGRRRCLEQCGERQGIEIGTVRRYLDSARSG